MLPGLAAVIAPGRGQQGGMAVDPLPLLKSPGSELWAGAYESTDMGKVTAAALLDGFNNLVCRMRGKQIVAGAVAPPSKVPPQATENCR